MKFDHYGVPTTEDHPGAGYHPVLKLHYSSSINPLFRIEHLKFDPDCIYSKEITSATHLAFEVDDIDGALEGIETYRLLHPKIAVSDTLTICYIGIDGLVVELMERKS